MQHYLVVRVVQFRERRLKPYGGILHKSSGVDLLVVRDRTVTRRLTNP